jgi:hypothetical protein
MTEKKMEKKISIHVNVNPEFVRECKRLGVKPSTIVNEIIEKSITVGEEPTTRLLVLKMLEIRRKVYERALEIKDFEKEEIKVKIRVIEKNMKKVKLAIAMETHAMKLEATEGMLDRIIQEMWGQMSAEDIKGMAEDRGVLQALDDLGSSTTVEDRVRELKSRGAIKEEIDLIKGTS